MYYVSYYDYLTFELVKIITENCRGLMTLVFKGNQVQGHKKTGFLREIKTSYYLFIHKNAQKTITINHFL